MYWHVRVGANNPIDALAITMIDTGYSDATRVSNTNTRYSHFNDQDSLQYCGALVAVTLDVFSGYVGLQIQLGLPQDYSGFSSCCPKSNFFLKTFLREAYYARSSDRRLFTKI